MPKNLEKCVKDVSKKGKSTSSAYAICTSSLQKAGKLSKTKKNSLELITLMLIVSNTYKDGLYIGI